MTHDWIDLARRARGVRNACDYDELWGRLEPAIAAWLRAPSFLGRVASDEDHRREIAMRAWAHLRAREFARLRGFAARPPSEGPQFHAYVRRIVRNLGIDYLRSLPEFIRRPAGEHWYTVVEWTPGHGGSAGAADAQLEARAMLAFLERTGRAPSRAALELWICGYDHADIAARLGLADAAAAHRMIGAAKELLRRHFRA